MQQPTCTGVKVRTIDDAFLIFYAVSQGILPIVRQRLSTKERRNLKAGDVYCWEQRGRDADTTEVCSSSCLFLTLHSLISTRALATAAWD